MTSTGRLVKFLWDSSMLLNSSSTHMNNILKSYLRNNCRKMAGTNAAIPLEKFSESQMCSCCSLHWQENKLKINYETQKVKSTTAKIKKLLKIFSDEKNRESQKKLTKKQRTRAKWLLKKAKNKLLINCEFCQHKTSINLQKSDVPKRSKIVTTEVSNTLMSHKKTKNTKLKNKTASLRLLSQKPGVGQGRTQNTSAQRTPQPKPRSKEVKNLTNQRKNLLQLAAMLKSKNISTLSSKNHLESFLK